jgi:hypothetical protein
MAKMPLAEYDNVAKTFLLDRTGDVSRRNTLLFDRPWSIRGNHRPIVGAPVAPHIAAPVTAESPTQTAGAVTVTAMAVTWSVTVAAAKVIAVKSITTPTITGAAGKCAGGKPGTSEKKDNCKNSDGVAQH